MSATTLHLPPTATLRLHMRPGQPFPHQVVVASAGGHPTPEAITAAAGKTSAMLTHDAGLAWPDRRGEALLAAMLDQGGDAVLAFERLEDALACKARLGHEVQR